MIQATRILQLTGPELEDGIRRNAGAWREVGYKGYDFCKILYADIAELTKLETPAFEDQVAHWLHNFGGLGPKSILKYAVSVCLKGVNRSIFEIKRGHVLDDFRPLFSFVEYHRKDYFELFKSVTSGCNEKTTILMRADEPLLRSSCRSNILLSAYYLLVLAKTFLLNRSRFKYHESWRKLFLSARYVELRQWVDFFEREITRIKPTHYIAFSDHKPYENLICQICQRLQIPTFTLQHGFYTAHPRERATVGNIQLDNLTADAFLCWGDASKRRFVENGRVPADKMIVVCHPLRHLQTVKDCVKKGSQFEINRLWVLCGAKMYEPSNHCLVEIANEVACKRGIGYSIKLHPSLERSRYESKYANRPECKSIVGQQEKVIDLGEPGDVFLCHTTTAYFEVLSRGFPCLRFRDNEFRDLGGLDDIFEDGEELEHLLSNLEETEVEAWLDSSRPLMDAVFGTFTKDPSSLYVEVIKRYRI